MTAEGMTKPEGPAARRPGARLTRIAGYGLAAAFAAVGVIFLFWPGRLLAFFDRLSRPLGMPAPPASDASLFLILSVAYMVVVTVLAWNMGRRPEETIYARLLAVAKISSALLSLGFFILRARYLVVLVNGAVDGLIGLGVLWLSLWAEQAAKRAEVD